MKLSSPLRALAALPFLVAVSFAQAGTPAPQISEDPSVSPYDKAAADVKADLKASLLELGELRESIQAERLPLSKQLNRLELTLSEARTEYQSTARLRDSRALDLSNLRGEIKLRKDEAGYITNLLGEYGRNFESRLHIAELKRYADSLGLARHAGEDTSISEGARFQRQVQLLRASLDRIESGLGGDQFPIYAVDSDGLLQEGTAILLGPIVTFVSKDGQVVGTAEAKLGSMEPAVIPFADPLDIKAAASVPGKSRGILPLDPTLGNAHLIESTHESFIEHVQKGGAVMIPIFAMAGLALLVAIYKWLVLMFTAKPSKRKVGALLDAMAKGDEEQIHSAARRVRGPVGRMLTAGVEHLREPQALIEEVMYETVLTTKLKLQSLLPFIAICAASAPLLGLLGTVTGIINTFKLITVFGSSDVKSLSGGISEALITTKFGLIVAIPSLLLHAFLSRKAKGITDQMEKSAVGFMNQVMLMRGREKPRVRPVHIAEGEVLTPAGAGAGPDPKLVRHQVNEVLQDLLGEIHEEHSNA